MHIKRYLAADLEGALARVREELGPEALVLSTRSVRRGGGLFGWLAKSVVEVVAATDRRAAETERKPAAERRVEPDPSWNGLLVTKSLIDPLEAELRGLRRTVEGLRAEQDGASGLMRELHTLRLAVGRLAEAQRGAAWEGTASALLEAVGLSARHAASVGEEAAQRADREGRLDVQVRNVLAERLDPLLSPCRDDAPGAVRILVGAPGVGKTTSVAKWVARDRKGRDTSVVSTDCQRLGADATLKGFADHLGVPFARASGAEDLSHQLGRAGRRRVFVDTAGCGRRDRETLSELVEIRGALGSRAEVDLVVSATTKESDLRAELARVSALAPDGLIVTHVDESEDLSNVVNVLLDGNAPPLRWWGTGQGVPQDWEIPEPGDLAERIVGGAA